MPTVQRFEHRKITPLAMSASFAATELLDNGGGGRYKAG